MEDLAYSKIIAERRDLFPWLKIYLEKLMNKFPNDFDKDLLQFLIQNIEKEVNALSNEEDTKRKEALFELLYDLFLHFWWRVRWESKKKWRKCWKTAYSEVTYSYDQHTKCIEKLLYYIIYLGIILSNGSDESEWTKQILKVLYILPSFDDMICNTLLRLSNLEAKGRHVYFAVLKHVLFLEVAEDISEPVTYIKIVLLFRKLKNFTSDRETLSVIKERALRMKAPPDTSDWLASLDLNLKFKEHTNIAEVLLQKKCSNATIRHLYQIITGKEYSNTMADSNSNKCEKLNNQSKVPDSKDILQNPHLPSSVEDSPLSWHSRSLPNNSKIKIRLNHKILRGFSTTPNTKELNKVETLRKKNKSKNVSSKIGDEGVSVSKAREVDDFLDLSFAKISNFSEKSNIDSKEFECAKEVKIIDVVGQDSLSGVHLYNQCRNSPLKKKDVISHNNYVGKRMRVESKTLKDNEIPSAKSTSIDISETTTDKSKESACLIQPENLNSYACNPLQLRNLVSQETDNAEKFSVFSPVHSSVNLDSLDSNTSNNGTERTHDSGKHQDYSQENIPHQCSESPESVLLKLVKSQDEKSSLNSKLSMKSSVENISKLTDGNNSPSDGGKFYIELSDSNSSLNQSSDPLQVTYNSAQHWEVPLQAQNKASDNSFKLINSAIFDQDTSNQNLSTMFNGISAENVSSIECSSQKSDKDLACSLQSDKNTFMTCTNRLDKNRFSKAGIKNMQSTQHDFTNSRDPSLDWSKVLQEKSVINKSNDESICIVKDESASHCKVDCKIVNDKYPNEEGTPSIKVFINVTCNSDKSDCNQQKEHIFGDISSFNDTNSKNVTSIPPLNYFNGFNSFSTEKSDPKMPTLTPYFGDLPFPNLGNIATPPDSELDVSIGGSIQKANLDTSTKFQNKIYPNAQACSTPKNSSSTLPENALTGHVDLKSPNASECESSNEWSLENTNLTNSLMLINSLQNSCVDDVLKQLNSKTGFVANNKNTKSSSLFPPENSSASYRKKKDIYSEDEFSEDSTLSCPESRSESDHELKNTSPNKPKSRKRSRKTASSKRKSYAKKPCKEQLKSVDLTASIVRDQRYNLRSRKSLSRPNNLENFVTSYA